MSRALLAVVCVVLAGCGKLRPSPLAPCPDFDAQIAPIATERCDRCHSGAAAEAGYRTTSYLAMVAARDDGTARIVPGDEASPFLAKVEGEHGHPAVEGEQLTLLKDWVRCRAPGREYQYHLKGWGNPGDAEQFHGKALRRQAYSTESCQSCHGDDLKGGKSEVSCFRCHAEGPLACSVCHGDADSPAPPRALDGSRATTSPGVGAHRAHVKNGSLHQAYACGVCHREVTASGQERHYQNSGHLDPLPAEVRILAQSAAPDRLASWEPEQATCENVKCHAPSRDGNATKQTPKWTVVDGTQAKCGTCHGLPPTTHPASSTSCDACHPRVYGRNHELIAPELHANGVVELGDGTAGCSACHGDATSPAPPRDLQGQTDAGLVSIGAHRAHLNANRYRGPIACEECHQVPSTPRSPGHLDHPLPAIVFPAVDGVGVLARTDGAQPAWSHAAATCASVYCHGGGAGAARDIAATLRRTPRWLGGRAEAACGVCHGVPPMDGFHRPTLVPIDCHQCHGASIAPDATFRWVTTDGGVPRTLHIDGVVQLGADAG